MWNEEVSPITWGIANDGRDVFTFHPIRGGDTAAAGDSFYISYIAFFGTESEALAYDPYQNERIVFNGNDFASAQIPPFDPEEVLSFPTAAETDGSYKLTFSQRSTVGKMQFNALDLGDSAVDRDTFEYVKVRYKYNFAHPDRSYHATLREGYSASAANHFLFNLPQNSNGEWIESVTAVTWGTADGNGSIFTFHPVREGGYAEIGDEFFIDYIGFFENETDAQNYNPHSTEPEYSGVVVKIYRDNEAEITLSPSAAEALDTDILTYTMRYFPVLPGIFSQNIIAYADVPLFGKVAVFEYNGNFFYTTVIPQNTVCIVFNDFVMREVTGEYILLEFVNTPEGGAAE